MSQAPHTVGNKIKKLRELKNFTQLYMAERLGIAQSSYSTIESGELDITLSRLNEIAKILEMRVEDVMAFDEKMVFNISHQHHSQNGYASSFQQTYSYEAKLDDLYKEIASLRERVGYLEGALNVARNEPKG